jgi:hypothetical protein
VVKASVPWPCIPDGFSRGSLFATKGSSDTTNLGVHGSSDHHSSGSSFGDNSRGVAEIQSVTNRHIQILVLEGVGILSHLVPMSDIMKTSHGERESSPGTDSPVRSCSEISRFDVVINRI